LHLPGFVDIGFQYEESNNKNSPSIIGIAVFIIGLFCVLAGVYFYTIDKQSSNYIYGTLAIGLGFVIIGLVPNLIIKGRDG
jgi:UDP-N-acetylmuramyl pentapeptide phosphotransferase/UDP-N-acetylglucosamine-1-phosphate transferase